MTTLIAGEVVADTARLGTRSLSPRRRSAFASAMRPRSWPFSNGRLFGVSSSGGSDMFNDKRRAIRKSRHELEFSADSLNIAAKRRKKDIAAPFDPRYRVLPDAQARRKLLLRALKRLAQLDERG